MSEFHRMITYLYLYEENRKTRNTGFAKIEKRDSRCLVEIHMKNTGCRPPAVPVYFYARKGEKAHGVLLGEINLSRGSGDFKEILDADHLGDSGFGLSEINGIYLPVSSQIMFVSQWDDVEFLRDSFTTDAPDSAAESGLAAKTGLTAAEADSSVKAGLTAAKAGPYAKADLAAAKAGPSSKADLAAAEAVPKPAPETSPDAAAVPAFHVVSPPFHTSGLQEDAPSGKDITGQPGCSGDSPIQDKGCKEAASPQSDSSQQGNASRGDDSFQQENASRRDDASQQENASRRDDASQQENTSRRDDGAYRENDSSQEDSLAQKWNFIAELLPEMTPFEGDNETRCVRMDLKDLRLLPKYYWYLGNNSFLLHGFFNYRYLILGMTGPEDKKHWFIGIPGIFQNPERVMASLFGFPGFRSERASDIKTGEFGYWYRYLED